MRLDIPLLLPLVLLAACAPGDRRGPTPDEPAPPMADKRPVELEKHGDIRVDDYYWLKERDNPEVIAYLEAENAYAEKVLAHTANLREELYREIVARIPKQDDSVPYRLGDHYYYERYEEGREYPIHCRKQGSLEAEEEVMMDVNLMAREHDYYHVNGLRISPKQDLLAYAVDTRGRRLYRLKVRDLTTGEDLDLSIPDVTGNHVWAADNRTLFYTRQHPETLRWYRIYRHVLGTDPAEDELVYEETDEEFNCGLGRSKSKRYLLMLCEQTLSTEVRYLEADNPQGEFKIFLPREPGHEYAVDHLGDHFTIRTNWEARNFRLMRALEGATGRESWEELIPHREEVFLQSFELFDDYLVTAERREGLVGLRVIPEDGSPDHYLRFDEPAYDAYFLDNYEPDTTELRYLYTSLTTPDSVFDYDMASRERTLRKEEEVLGGFDSADYRTERLMAPARDGERVPVSLVYRKELFRGDGSNPLLLYGYGSYGSSIDPDFRSHRLSLIDRGFVFAVAHVRGGQELGRRWYEEGKLLEKKNTFTDFIDVGRHLVAEDYTSPDRLLALGRSAGGLLMGAITTMAPELFEGVVSEVAFVDVVTTMLDPEIPLTTSEYDEWGNPNDRQYYDYMLSYSPYDNVEAKDYPHLLLTTGLHDSQVQYWEPAKFAAKLRATKTGDNRLLLLTDMGSGHSGTTGRFKRHRKTAVIYAFLLDLAGRG